MKAGGGPVVLSIGPQADRLAASPFSVFSRIHSHGHVHAIIPTAPQHQEITREHHYRPSTDTEDD